jgi:endonuclease/exonuclease/phosphatase family metal-dependent hydrolase
MNKAGIRRYIKYLLVSINIVLAFIYLLGCIVPWIASYNFWSLNVIAIAMPYLFVAIFLSIIFWLFVKRKIAFYFFIILCVGYRQIEVMFSFKTNTTFKKTKANYNIRLVSWNIGNLDGRVQNKNVKRHSVDEIINSLLKQNADVICLQEFEDCKKGCKSQELIKKKYPYYYFPGWIIGPYRHGSGNAIFSKYPIIKGDSTRFENGENIISVDIVVNDDTISFFTTHFESFKFTREEFKEIDGIVSEDALPQKNLTGIISKMKNTMISHCEEAEVVTKFLSNAKYPVVFSGDLNEVSNSSIYWKVKEDRQDAFLVKGFGFGKTFNSLSPVLRIDYIMPDKNFEINQFNIIEEGLSDHSLLVADIVLKKYQTEKTNN